MEDDRFSGHPQKSSCVCISYRCYNPNLTSIRDQYTVKVRSMYLQTPRDLRTAREHSAESAKGTSNSGKLRVWAVLWLVLLIVAAAIANLAADWLLAFLEVTAAPELRNALTGVFILTLLLYVLLLAVPFVPGAEIGLFLLMALGVSAAPYVYLATVAGLLLSFFAGRYVPISMLCMVLRAVGFHRACTFMEEIGQLSHEQRSDLIRATKPGPIGAGLVRFRYLAMAIGLNVPGNSVIGGGGGIALAAGLCRVFSPVAAALTISVAVSPVPLMVYFFGARILAP
jgi:hypothetical protein